MAVASNPARAGYCATPTSSHARPKCGMTALANSSWFLIAIQWEAPPALTVIPISWMPAQTAWVASIRSMMSWGVPTQT